MSISAWGNYIGAGGAYDDGTNHGIAYLFYHARPIPPVLRPFLGDDDDDGDDDEALAIPFSNYYFLFAIIAIAALIMRYKRKIITTKK